MGKRKGKRSEKSETLICRLEDDDDDNEMDWEEEKEKEKGGGFFACYLLTSLSPRHKGHTYIGFTVNPRRRIRQHNGELRCGAVRTKNKRPWEMVFCIYGFPTHVSALQFEWAWQHPTESLAVRKAAATFKTLGGIANKVKLAYTMLTLPAWQSLNLTVNFFSTKYTNHYAGCPTLPEQMKVQVRSMDELPCYSTSHNVDESEDGLDDDDEASNCYRYKEGSTEIEVQNSLNHQGSIEETTNEQNGSMEEIGMGPSRVSVILEECTSVPPACLRNSPVQVPFVSDGFVPSGYTESRDKLGFVEDGNVEFDPPTGNCTPILATTVEDQPISDILEVPREVEIIDLLSPSPSYRIRRPHGKKRRASTVCPELIDLTNSPIFV